MKQLYRCWLAVALVACTVAHAADSAAVTAVRRADNARLAAMMAGDGRALAALMSDELKFVHSDGRIESKAQYVKNMMAGDTQYADAKTSEVTAVEPAPNVVILIGAQQMRKRLGTTWSQINLRYMAVWRNESGTWRMFAWQSMRPAGNSVIPKK
ncbi:MAG: nuclear transport factor 2 family protein [Opitutaceae bacterium]|nr:nuclear transport factor 2 family protein [Opitutaceae bacterium]